MPILIGSLHDNGMPLATAMSIPIAVALSCSAAFIWFGPETRGRHLTTCPSEPTRWTPVRVRSNPAARLAADGAGAIETRARRRGARLDVRRLRHHGLLAG